MIFALDSNHLIHVMYHITESKDPADVSERFLNRLCYLRQWADQTASEFGERISRCIATFDPPGKSYRASIATEYKANRSTDAGVYDAIDHAWAALEYADDWQRCLAPAGFEADDALATIAAGTDEKVIVHSADKDLNQCLVDGRVGLVKRSGVEEFTNINGYPVGGELEVRNYTARMLKSDFGIGPERWVDFQCLVGDSADNIKGADGIGPVTAMRLMQEHDGEVETTPIDGLNKRQRAGWQSFIERLAALRDIFTLQTNLEEQLIWD